MIRKSAAFTVVGLFIVCAAFAAPQKKAKTTDCNVCPLSGHDAKASKATTVVGKYNVHFCCTDCQGKFAKLSKKEQNAKIQAAMKPVKKAETTTETLTQVNVCPITGEKVEGAGGGSLTCGKYEVHFCCAGCKPAFEKMSAEEKQAKIQEALKKS